ncbi:MAG: ParA family protein [Magnetococcales bacterium]|nr:ParA family protein [Magnetococcales bacterium]
MKSIAFFNNKGGVGKTSLVYHLAWMFEKFGVNVLAVDLDPQANLTAMFLEESRLEEVWSDDDQQRQTVYGAINPILRGTGDIARLTIEKVTPKLGLVPGDLGLSRFEDKLSDAWPRCHNRDESAFRTMTAFHRLMLQSADWGADIVLMDVGPNLGAINRAALIASDHVVLPLGADLFSLQGMKNLGPTMRDWRKIWKELLSKGPSDLPMPTGDMSPIGYVVSQHGIRESRPVKSYQRWVARIPRIYREAVLDRNEVDVPPRPEEDPHALAMLKHYRSLMPMAMDSHKPMFFLKSSDGAIGSHIQAVHDCHDDFFNLAKRIAFHAGLTLSDTP